MSREAEVSGQFRAGVNRYFLSGHTFDKGAGTWVGCNDTVIARSHLIEQILTVCVGQSRSNRTEERRQVCRTVAGVQVNDHVRQSRINRWVKAAVAIVVDVALIANLTVWREAEVSRQHVGDRQRDVLAASALDWDTR